MIISASRRTDIPCFYADWFMNRIRAGYVLTRNPMNPAQVSRIQLSPNVIDGIVFWTKDAANMLPHLAESDRLGYKYYFQHTITPYDQRIERYLRPKEQIEDTFIELSKCMGKNRVVWRYDPIIISDCFGIEAQKHAFRRMCEKLSPYTDTVTMSFVDWYEKLKFSEIRVPNLQEMAELSAFIGETARAYGLSATACCEKEDLTPYGIAHASCIDSARIERICGCPLAAKNDKNQRVGCGCCSSVDIGAYDTCLNGCTYCYANRSFETVKKRLEQHDPKGELLVGSIREGEKVVVRKAETLLKRQTSLI